MADPRDAPAPHPAPDPAPPPAPAPAPDEVVVVHSSDLHVDDGHTARLWSGDGAGPLAAVIETARVLGADAVLLAGDVFEHNRLPQALLDRAGGILRGAPCPVVMLPGNHDPLTEGSVWRRGGFAAAGHVHVLGLDGDRAALPGLGLEVWGRAHRDYSDMEPLAGPGPRSRRWHMAAGHGHFVEERPPAGARSPSWLITGDEIEATAADYVALGHWNRPVRVGAGRVPAWYSGSPDLAGTVNVVRLRAGGGAAVSREPVRGLPAR